MKAKTTLDISVLDFFVLPDGDHVVEQILPGKLLLFLKLDTDRRGLIHETRFIHFVETGQAVRKSGG